MLTLDPGSQYIILVTAPNLSAFSCFPTWGYRKACFCCEQRQNRDRDTSTMSTGLLYGVYIDLNLDTLHVTCYMSNKFRESL